MKKRHLLIAVALGILVAAGPALAVSWGDLPWGESGIKKTNVSGMQFMKIGTSARAEGMGNAFAAVADDINALFYNGAGLVHVERVAYAFNYTRWLADTNIYSMGMVLNTRSARGEVVGFSVLSHQPKKMPETTIYQPNGTGETVDVSDLQVGAVYAIKFTDKFSFSAKVNYVQSIMYEKKTKQFTIDVGSYFYTGFRSLRVAMSFRNFGPDKKTGDNYYMMPLMYSMGLAGEIYGEKGDPTYLTLAAESMFPIDYEQRYHLGAELWIQNALALRGGYKWNYDLEQFAIGAGVKQSLRGRDLFVDVSYSFLQKQEDVKMFDPPLRVSVGGTF